MAINQRRYYLISYDISMSARRLIKVHRYMVQRGVPMQYSLFMVEATTPMLMRLKRELAQIIKASLDDIRIYPLPKQAAVKRVGKQFFPPEVMLITADHELLQMPADFNSKLDLKDN